MGKIKNRPHRKWSYNSLHIELPFVRDKLIFDAAPSIKATAWRILARHFKEPGGKGSFQAVKLQRPARTTVCRHSARDMAAMGSIESKHDIDDTQDECLSSCRQL